jgi:hypothetical protein
MIGAGKAVTMASSDRKLPWLLRATTAVALTFATLQALAGPSDRPQPVAAQVHTATPTSTPGPVGDAGRVRNGAPTNTLVSAATPTTDPDYFAETGFSIGAPFREFFRLHGGARTFGPPISSVFRLEGSPIQLFRDRALRQDLDGAVSAPDLLRLLVPDNWPLRVDGATLPAVNAQLVDSAPSPEAPGFAVQVRAFVRANAPAGFYEAFLAAGSPPDATPAAPADATRLADLALEVWGLPLSRPAPDPNDPRALQLRWEGGVMRRDSDTGQVRTVPLGAHFRAVLTGENLPQDLAADVQASPYYRQYSPASPGGVARLADLPDSVLSGAFQPAGPTAVPGTGAAAIGPTPTVAGSAPTTTPTPTPGAESCTGDEEISYAPEVPRVGNELVIVVTSASLHPHGRLLGTEGTTLVGERDGRRGKVWEWTVAPTYKGKHRYTFYADSTIPCGSISIEVRAAVSNASDNANSNSNSNGNSNDNSSPSDDDAPKIRDVRAAARSTEADIRWTTNETSDSEVEYRASGSGTSTAFDSAHVVSHSMRLTDLRSSTTYRYRVRSTDAAGNLARSDELSFTTPAP